MCWLAAISGEWPSALIQGQSTWNGNSWTTCYMLPHIFTSTNTTRLVCVLCKTRCICLIKSRRTCSEYTPPHGLRDQIEMLDLAKLNDEITCSIKLDVWTSDPSASRMQTYKIFINGMYTQGIVNYFPQKCQLSTYTTSIDKIVSCVSVCGCRCLLMSH